MVSQDSSSDPATSVVHQFIVSNSISNRTHFNDRDNSVFQSDGRNRNSFLHSPSVHQPRTESFGHRVSISEEQIHVPNISEETHNFSTRLHLMNLHEPVNEIDHHGQRLSLTLGSHLIPSPQYQQQNFISSNYYISGEEAREICSPREKHTRDENSFLSCTNASSMNSHNQSCSTSFQTESFATIIGSSRYLKPTQSLLNEVVSVGASASDLSSDKAIQRLTRNRRREEAIGFFPESTTGFCSNGLYSSTAEHDLQIKISKLISLLDEVENKYQQYCHQMEEVASSFEIIAGSGASKSYTNLALQAMSKHFCSVRNAIVNQIKLAKKQLSQGSPRLRTGLSQLSLFDQEPRQNRVSLQELGLIQNQSQQWRPIRGLPENSVMILRSWLFEHFLHPYPNDSEKLMLSSQTGLSKNQVSNWFINARVRLWKPMIEEIYKAEFDQSSPDSEQATELGVPLTTKGFSDGTRKHRVMGD